MLIKQLCLFPVDCKISQHSHIHRHGCLFHSFSPLTEALRFDKLTLGRRKHKQQRQSLVCGDFYVVFYFPHVVKTGTWQTTEIGPHLGRSNPPKLLCIKFWFSPDCRNLNHHKQQITDQKEDIRHPYFTAFKTFSYLLSTNNGQVFLVPTCHVMY